MKTNVNNSENKYTRKAIEALKSEIKANAIEEIELTKYGIQIYAAYLNTEEYVEYYVVMKARRDIRTGRYYFITREGERIAWSRLTAETLTVAAVDFLDAIESEEKRAAEALARLECYGLQHLESRFFFLWVRPLLDTIGTAYHIEATGFNDLGETIDLVTIDNGDRVPAWDAIEAAPSDVLATWKADRIAKAEALHAAAWYVAAVKVSELTGQISEEQERRRKASEAADRFEAAAVDRVKTAAEYLTKGAEVEAWTLPTRYVVRLTQTAAVVVSAAELSEAKTIAAETLRPATDWAEVAAESKERKTIETQDTPAERNAARVAFDALSETKRKAITFAARLLADGGTIEDRGDYFEVSRPETCDRVTIDAVDADHLRHLLSRKAIAAETIALECKAKSYDAAAERAATRASRCKTIAEALRKAARVVLLAVTLTTGTPADAETIESEPQAADVAELLTTDPVNELAALRAAGLTVARFEIKTAPATLREVAAC